MKNPIKELEEIIKTEKLSPHVFFVGKEGLKLFDRVIKKETKKYVIQTKQR